MQENNINEDQAKRGKGADRLEILGDVKIWLVDIIIKPHEGHAI